MAVNLEDPSNSRNLRDFLYLYNVLTEQCFERCVKRFHDKSLTKGETECANQCTDRYVAFNQKLMFTFVQHQNKKNKALEEATQAAIAAGNLPPQMAAPAAGNLPPQMAAP